MTRNIRTARRPRLHLEVWMKVRNPGQLRRWRMQRHYTQRELAFLVRCSQQMIQQLETGKVATCSERLAVAIAARLDVPWEDLFETHERVRNPQVHESQSRTAESLSA